MKEDSEVLISIAVIAFIAIAVILIYEKGARVNPGASVLNTLGSGVTSIPSGIVSSNPLATSAALQQQQQIKQIQQQQQQNSLISAGIAGLGGLSSSLINSLGGSSDNGSYDSSYDPGYDNSYDSSYDPGYDTTGDLSGLSEDDINAMYDDNGDLLDEEDF